MLNFYPYYMSDASGLSIEVSEKEESDFENMSTCDSPGPCLQNRQCPRQFMQHFPSMSLARDISDNESESSGKSVTSMVDGEIIKYKKLNYLKVEKMINT